MLTSLIKSNPHLYRAARFVRRQLYRSALRKYGTLPISDKQILFINFNGRGYGDNPKAISECLHRQDPSLALLWAVKGEDSSLPDYVTAVPFESQEYYKALATSRVWVSNVFMPEGTIKRREQLYVQTWHGDRPLKKIFDDAAKDLPSYRKRHGSRYFESDGCDYITTGSRFAEELYRRGVGYRGKFITDGCPRNDRLLNASAEECAQIRASLGIGQETKVLLFAPTFRDNQVREGANDSDIDLTAILDRLKERNGCPWMCILRAHGGTRLIRKDGREDDRFLDLTRYPDMTDLLMITDYLITDYSSCATDFHLTGKPILFYQDDIEEYTSQNRTLYYTAADECFRGVCNMTDALSLIDRCSEEDYRRQDEAISAFYDTYESGRAACACAQVILDEIRNAK